MDLKKKIILIVVAAALVLIGIFAKGFGGQPQVAPEEKQAEESTVPLVISTNPSPLDNATVLPTQVIEITYNHPIENPGEVKYSIDPEIDVKISLSDDRKTIKVTPNKPFNLGGGYTLVIKGDTKFDGGKRQDGDKVYHFTTISYRGV